MDKKRSMMEKKSTSVILSVTSLVLIMCLLVITTYSWVDSNDHDDVDTNEMSLQLDTGLDAKWEDSDENSIDISGFDLREVSSANGRDFYTPDDSFNEVTADDGVQTNELRFRKVNSADIYNGKDDKGKNKKMVQFTFSLSTQVLESTPVYLSKISSISGTGSEHIRVSIDSHDGGTPTIFSNTAVINTDGGSKTQNAVSSIDNDTGVPVCADQSMSALNAYTYSRKAPLFTIAGRENKKITVSIWLEGASGNFSSDIVNNEDIKISLILTTKKDYTNTVQVVDRTVNNWLKNGETDSTRANMFIINASDYSLSKPLSEMNHYSLSLGDDEKTWTAQLPQNVTKIYIRRYSKATTSNSWDYWGPLELPGAAELNSSGTMTDKKAGLKLVYNILGDSHEGTKDGVTYPNQIDNYEAGLWGNFSDSYFKEVTMFDQTRSNFADTNGMFCYFNQSVTGADHKKIPYVNMELSYTYEINSNYKPKIESKIRYRMYPKNVTKRLFHANVFVNDAITTSNAGIVPYYANANATQQAPIEFGSGWMASVNAGYSYFAINKSDIMWSYWGKSFTYLNLTGDIVTEDSKDSGHANYQAYFNSSSSNDKYKVFMAPLDDTYMGNQTFTWSNSNRDYGAVIPKGYETSVQFYRRSAGDNTEWNYSEATMDLAKYKDARFNKFGTNWSKVIYYDVDSWKYTRENVPR